MLGPAAGSQAPDSHGLDLHPKRFRRAGTRGRWALPRRSWRRRSSPKTLPPAAAVMPIRCSPVSRRRPVAPLLPLPPCNPRLGPPKAGLRARASPDPETAPRAPAASAAALTPAATAGTALPHTRARAAPHKQPRKQQDSTPSVAAAIAKAAAVATIASAAATARVQGGLAAECALLRLHASPAWARLPPSRCSNHPATG
mmetsp:Transcript_178535/g.572182  ORF Transcript_178535/g.572182 Transcript_178535/m.572182 type:complete len:200 (+) Transcript_178535:298-897(+)